MGNGEGGLGLFALGLGLFALRAHFASVVLTDTFIFHTNSITRNVQFYVHGFKCVLLL